MQFLKKTLPILVLTFLLSVAMRLPQLGRPLSKHHEFCTAVSLRILQIWYDNGIEKYGYNPVMTYENEQDKNINNFANASGKMIDKEGRYYYVSHPPFAYYFPYYIFKLIQIRPAVLPLQILHLFFHFLSAFFVYLTVSLLSHQRARSMLHFPSFVAYLVYIFLPATLWFQSNVYMSDMAVQLPFVIGVYIVLKMIIRQKFYVPKYIFFYSLNLFLMIYTSWLGVFFAVGVLIYSLLHVMQTKGFKMLIWSSVIILFITIRLIFYQYSQINDSSAYMSELLNRYLQRGSMGDFHGSAFRFIFSYFFLFKNLFYNYFVNYLPIYIVIIGFIYIAATQSRLKIVFSENGYRFIWLSVLPVVLLHLVFLNYSSHDFTVLYASLFLSVLMGILYDKVKKSGYFSAENLNRIMIVVIVILIAQFEISNLPGQKSIYGDEYALAEKTGKFVKENTTRDETIFMMQEADPQTIFYASRNIQAVKSKTEALDFMKQYQRKKGVLFSTDLKQERFNLEK